MNFPKPSVGMLPNDRLDYSAIPARKPLKLPKGARMVVWTITNVEEWDPTQTMPRTVLTPPAGGSPMPEVVLRKAMEVLPSWTFINGYGMTELSPFVTGFELTADMASGPKAALLKSCGHAAIGCEVRVVGVRDQPLAILRLLRMDRIFLR